MRGLVVVVGTPGTFVVDPACRPEGGPKERLNVPEAAPPWRSGPGAAAVKVLRQPPPHRLDAMPERGPNPRPTALPLRFGPAGRFELQPAERRLLVDGRPVAVGGRALDVLITLAVNPDHLLTKNELLERAWPGVIV